MTTEDFIHSMQLVSGFDFTTFFNWYNVKGTPIVAVNTWYDGEKNEYTVEISQRHSDSNVTEIMCIPLRFKLFDEEGKTIAADFEYTLDKSIVKDNGEDTLLILQDDKVRFKVKGCPSKPLLSINRSFTAPINLERNWDLDEIFLLSKYDDDLFNRWDYGQFLFRKNILDNLESATPSFDGRLIESVASVLEDPDIDEHFKAEFIYLPSEAELNEGLKLYDFDNVHRVREELKLFLAKSLKDNLSAAYEKCSGASDDWNASNMAKRELKNIVLDYLLSLGDAQYANICYQQFSNATNMSDELAALKAINYYDSSNIKEVNQAFVNRWGKYSLIMDKWFGVQASAQRGNIITRMKELEESPYFDKKNPNKIYSLFATFVSHNLVQFHQKDGSGYQYIADKVIEIDGFNPQVASRVAKNFKNLKKLDSERRERSKAELERILKTPNLSGDTYEVVSKTLEYQ